MNQLGFFDFYIRLSRIDKAGDPLVKINKAIDWEIFRPILEEAKRGRHPVECCFSITTMLKTSFSVQIWSVKSAAIAGVRGSHFSPEFSSAFSLKVFSGLMKLGGLPLESC
ncbi:hypothetical protein GCAAIG_11195 [Candidatus Electronema halotolerans]